MSVNNPSFFNRSPANTSVDYITIVNKKLRENPSSVDPNSILYSDAIKQYNGELKKGNTVRLDVPKGFCGYIDPTSGNFRVQPDPDLQTIPPGQSIPSVSAEIIITELPEGEYPVDQCLQNGLAGSPSYSQTPSRASGEFGEYTKLDYTSCGSDIDPVTDSKVRWELILHDYYVGAPPNACMAYWQPGGEGYEASAAASGGEGAG